MNEFVILIILVLCWLRSTSDYKDKPNFVDGFNTVVIGLVVMGYIGFKLYLQM